LNGEGTFYLPPSFTLNGEGSFYLAPRFDVNETAGQTWHLGSIERNGRSGLAPRFDLNGVQVGEGAEQRLVAREGDANVREAASFEDGLEE